MTSTSSRSILSIACVGVTALLGGCPDDEPVRANPARLWLALDGRETEVRLVPVEPPEF